MILRPISLTFLTFLCLLVTALLMFCAIYSLKHGSLLAYTGDIYGGRYFLFGFLPQITAAILLLYIHAVMSALIRILPFAMMASAHPETRAMASFMRLHPASLLAPQLQYLSVYPALGVCFILLWLVVFTIPLQSSVFAAVVSNGGWQWAAVQGVIWTLIVIYILITAALIYIIVFIHNPRTGLQWDPRDLADILAMLPLSNSLQHYTGIGSARHEKESQSQVGRRIDRLGYWRTTNSEDGIFYCIGEAGGPTTRYSMQSGKAVLKAPKPKHHAGQDLDPEAQQPKTEVNSDYLPWYLGGMCMILWPLIACVLLIALFIVSFLPSTALHKGFRALVVVKPDGEGFSSANFLYSFVPSVVGMVLYLLFQPLDMAFRVLQPWAELRSPEGAVAERSLLVDYAACLPGVVVVKAAANKHYRVAALSLLSPLSILLPVLGGGLFFPLTTLPSGRLLMLANLSAFYVVLAFLILYLLALLLVMAGRRRIAMPHAVTCLAEVLSLLRGSKVLGEREFEVAKGKVELATRLVAKARSGEPKKFAFVAGRGIERVV